MNLSEDLKTKFEVIGEDRMQFIKFVLSRVLNKIKKGGSALKGPIETGMIKIPDMIRAIKHNRCLRTPDRDFGSSYIEQIIGSAIRETIPIRHINQARGIFGLSKLPPSELIKNKKEQMQQPLQ